MEGEDMDEADEQHQQQQQQLVVVDKKQMELNSATESPAAEAEMPVDKVRWLLIDAFVINDLHVVLAPSQTCTSQS